MCIRDSRYSTLPDGQNVGVSSLRKRKTVQDKENNKIILTAITVTNNITEIRLSSFLRWPNVSVGDIG